MSNKIAVELDNIVSHINTLRDEIVQLEEDNEKLNDDLQLLDKERDDGYKSFNTDTHILINRDELDSLKSYLYEINSSAGYASDECCTAESSAEDARRSVDNMLDEVRDAQSLLKEILNKGDDNENK